MLVHHTSTVEQNWSYYCCVAPMHERERESPPLVVMSTYIYLKVLGAVHDKSSVLFVEGSLYRVILYKLKYKILLQVYI